MDSGCPQQDRSLAKELKVVIEFIILVLKILVEIIVSAIKCFLPAQKENVKNKTVLITGAAHGIGKELAIQYGQLGARVICVDINKSLNEETVEGLRKFGIAAFSYICNVGNKSDVEKIASEISNEIGAVDVLVNNAGVLYCKKLLDLTENQIYTSFQVNILAQFWVVQAFLPDMIKAGRGHIVAISSMGGLEGKANASSYCATKFAIRGLMEALADESRENSWNINCTTVFPFFVDTGMCEKPKIRFTGIQSTRKVASAIISAQQSRVRELTIPGFLGSALYATKIFPPSAQILIQEFFGAGIRASST